MYQDLTSLTNLYNQNKVILTGVVDVDYNILMNLDTVDLSVICRTNKYAEKLCHTTTFWKRKFDHDHLPILNIHTMTLSYWLILHKLTKRSKIFAEIALTIYDIEYHQTKVRHPIVITDYQNLIASVMNNLINYNFTIITHINILPIENTKILT